MSGRANWYSDHPPACTCAQCRGSGGRHGRRRGPISSRRSSASKSPPLGNAPYRGASVPEGRGRNAKGGCFALGLFIILVGLVGVGLLAYRQGYVQIGTEPNSPGPFEDKLVPATFGDSSRRATAQSLQVRPSPPAKPSPVPTPNRTPGSIESMNPPPEPTTSPSVEASLIPVPTLDPIPPIVSTVEPTKLPTPASSATPMPQISRAPVTIPVEITLVSFVGAPGYTLYLKAERIHSERDTAVVTLLVSHKDGTSEPFQSSFVKTHDGSYFGSVTVAMDRVEHDTLEWVRDNISVGIVIPSEAGRKNLAGPASTNTTKAATAASPTATAQPTNTPRPEATIRPTSTPTRIITPIPASAPTPSAVIKLKKGSPQWITALEYRIHALVNSRREEPLAWDPSLTAIARLHSQDMGANNYFSHTNLLGQSPTDRAGVAGYICRKNFGSYYTEGVAENIFYSSLFGRQWYLSGISINKEYYSLEELATLVVEGWMDSPGHRQNILNQQYDREGIGIAIDSDEKVFVTQNFC